MARNLRHRSFGAGARTGFVLFIATLLLSGAAGFALRPARAADTPAVALSAGCTGLNDPFYDGRSAGANAGTGSFLAGERISVAAGDPSSGAPQSFTVYVNFMDTVIKTFPGTFTFTVPTDGSYNIFWGIDTGTDATWSVSCREPGQDSTPTPTPEPTATAVPSTDTCVARGNENAERASQNGKEHSCLDQSKTSTLSNKPGKGNKHNR
jgi:hypothetical protein